MNTFVDLLCDFSCIPLLKLSFQKLLGRTVYCQVERLEIVGHIGRNENANAVVISNKVLNTLRLLSFDHVKY